MKEGFSNISEIMTDQKEMGNQFEKMGKGFTQSFSLP